LARGFARGERKVAPPTGLSAKQLGVLDHLKAVPSLDGYYLAGGSAIGWLCSHRRSIDLDLFSSAGSSPIPTIVRALTRAGARVQAETDVAAALRTGGVLVDIVHYPYPPLRAPFAGPGGFPTASALDLAVMKLAAIAKRGLRRDFWDLYVLAEKEGFRLPRLLKAYQRRFRRAASDTYHVARALTFFEDAEREDPRVVGLSGQQWREIMQFFRSEATRLFVPRRTR
jgi:hypothetical protein